MKSNNKNSSGKMEVATGAVNVANECFWLRADGSSVFNLITHAHYTNTERMMERDRGEKERKRELQLTYAHRLSLSAYKYIEQINFEMLTTFCCLFINEAIVTFGSSRREPREPPEPLSHVNHPTPPTTQPHPTSNLGQ